LRLYANLDICNIFGITGTERTNLHERRRVMSMLVIVGIIYGIAIVGLMVAIWSDRRWYRRHPGAEEKFGRIDDELCKKEGR